MSQVRVREGKRGRITHIFGDAVFVDSNEETVIILLEEFESKPKIGQSVIYDIIAGEDGRLIPTNPRVLKDTYRGMLFRIYTIRSRVTH